MFYGKMAPDEHHSPKAKSLQKKTTRFRMPAIVSRINFPLRSWLFSLIICSNSTAYLAAFKSTDNLLFVSACTVICQHLAKFYRKVIEYVTKSSLCYVFRFVSLVLMHRNVNNNFLASNQQLYNFLSAKHLDTYMYIHLYV